MAGKGTAGFNTRILATGTSTLMTNEPCSLVGGQVYQITDSARRIIDGDLVPVPVVRDNGVIVATSNYSIDYNYGIITFIASYSINTPIVITANFLPAHNGARAMTVSAELSYDDEETTTFGDEAQDLTLTTQRVSLTIDFVEPHETNLFGSTTLADLFLARTLFVIDIQWRGVLSPGYRIRCHGQSMEFVSEATGLVKVSESFSGSSEFDAQLISKGIA